jgi:hypothetical protein
LEELMTMLLSTLTPHAILAVQSDYTWINIFAVAIIAVMAVGCAVALKKS